MDSEEQQSLLAPTAEFLASVKVFPLIPHIKNDIMKTIDSALSWEQLTASDINFSIVRPLVHRYANLKNMATVYACLVVRSYFLSQAGVDLALTNLMISRAQLCELLAMKLLARYASTPIHLAAVLTTSWNPLTGALPDMVDQVRSSLGGDEDDLNFPQSTIEVAISTNAKRFLSSPVCQTVVNDIYSGRINLLMISTRSILADNYKPRAVEYYDSRKAPFLDHYRLRVPKYHAILEFMNVVALLVSFVLCLSNANLHRVNFWEGVFVVFALSFALEEYTASKEHGWAIYAANVWNTFDTSFVAIFLVYLIFRIRGLTTGDIDLSDTGFDILACGACILFPRLAFFAISNNMVVLSLRAMISEFVFFISIAVACFSGLLFTLWTLAGSKWKLKSIAWLMVQIWFGNTYLSFAQAESFHPVFGPILMTGFAALSNTLLLTILISILSNTVARINENATQEYLFQFAISTIEGIKSDALLSYQLPFNLLAFIVLKPASCFLTPRGLHTLNVFLIKLTSFPVLVAIGVYERYFAPGQKFRDTRKDATNKMINSLPRHIKNMPFFDALVGSDSSDLYEAIFELNVDTHDFQLFDSEDDEDEGAALRTPASRDSSRPGNRNRSPLAPPQTPRRGRDGSQQPLAPSRLRIMSNNLLSPQDAANRSPLAQLFAPKPTPDPQLVANTEASVRRMESLMEDIKGMPVKKLKDEMKELQDRQARIENLLLMLTRGMRNETGHRDTLP